MANVYKRVQGPRAVVIVGSVFILFGLVGLMAAGALAALEFASGRSARAEGIMIASRGLPLVKFRTADGQDVQIQSRIRSSLWSDGDKVIVAYDPKAPGNGSIDAIAGRWFLPFLFGALGTFFATVGIVLGVTGRVLSRRVV